MRQVPSVNGLCAFKTDIFRQGVVCVKRKHFYSVREYAKERHFEPRHVRRLCHEHKVSAFKEGRRWVILADQTKKARVTWHYYAPGKRVPIPPTPPEGLIWDMAKGRFVLIEKYAKEHGYRVVRVRGKRRVEITSSPGFCRD